MPACVCVCECLCVLAYSVSRPDVLPDVVCQPMEFRFCCLPAGFLFFHVVHQPAGLSERPGRT